MRGIEEDVIRARSTEIRIIRRQRRAEGCRRVLQDRAPSKRKPKFLSTLPVQLSAHRDVRYTTTFNYFYRHFESNGSRKI